jgi:TRAP-type C4-dicarboxylate transport system permease small subunit
MKKSYQAIKYLCWDFCAAILAWFCFYYCSIQLYQENIFIPIHLPPYITTSLIGAIWLLIYSFSGFYVNVLQKSRVKECFLLLFVTVIGVVIIFFFFYIDNHWTNSPHTIYNLLFLYFGLHFNNGKNGGHVYL